MQDENNRKRSGNRNLENMSSHPSQSVGLFSCYDKRNRHIICWGPNKCIVQVINIKTTKQGKNSFEIQQLRHEDGFVLSSIPIKYLAFCKVFVVAFDHASVCRMTPHVIA